MRKIMVGILAAAAILFGTASVASACPIKGKVVCTGTTVPAEGVDVVFTPVSGWAFDFCAPVSDLTDALGIFGTDAFGNVVMHLCGGTYSLNLDPTFTVTCDNSNSSGIDLTATPFEANGPSCAPPPPKPADCSPGYYKNHPQVWSQVCAPFFGNLTASQILWMLSANLGATVTERDAAKALLDACFGTAAASPCMDD